MIVDDPQTKAEVEAQFAAYERALVSNDVAALDRFFLASDAAIDLRSGARRQRNTIAADAAAPRAIVSAEANGKPIGNTNSVAAASW